MTNAHSAATSSADLLLRGVEVLRELLGEDWQVSVAGPPGTDAQGVDAVLMASSPSSSANAQLLVDLKLETTPREVEQVLAPKQALIRQINQSMNYIIVAPWISPRVQQMLRTHKIGYLDLTGNISIRVSMPTIILHAEGERKKPKAGTVTTSSKPTLSGLRAGRLVRLLVDVKPPYRATDIAEATNLSLPWVSRLLGLLEEQVLIRRTGKVIESVDWVGLLHARAASYDLLHHNSHVGMLAANGVDEVLDRLRVMAPAESENQPTTVTGSYAAHSVAPLTSGGQLMLYVPHDPHTLDDVGDQLRLLRTREGADVLLLRAYDRVVFERRRRVDGLSHVALSQLALDCLSGPGRMPAEGESVIAYMVDTEDSWRAKSIPTR